MSELAFLGRGIAVAGDEFAPRYRSPLERALAGARADVRDVSQLGKLEVRGELDGLTTENAVRITPRRALVLCDAAETAALAARLRKRFEYVLDVSAAYAGLLVRGEPLLRRLTDLDLEALPAVGPAAGVPAVVLRDGKDFTLLFPQEYADHVAAVVLDAARGLE